MLSRCYTISGNKVEVSASHLITREFIRSIHLKSFRFCVLEWIFLYPLFLLHWRCLTITELMINEQIRDKEVRLISDTGEQLGIVSSKEAQKIADEKKLDLVKIAPNAKPPVCRIMDYGKYKFDQAKKEKEARKKQKTIETKELRLSPSIDDHDIQVKVKKAIEFLKNGDKVKVSIRFRGRELGRTSSGEAILENFANSVSEFGVIDKPAKMEARSLVMFLAPKA